MLDLTQKIISLTKQKGFIFPSSEIYGGIQGFYDYGPLGVQLKNNIKNAWWRAMVQERDDIFGLDAAIIMNPTAWVASGHVSNFTDPLVECKACHKRFRADHLADKVKEGRGFKERGLSDEDAKDWAKVLEGTKCPDCKGELTAPRLFNLMFKTFAGPAEDSASQVYLRPETAQGIFTNYKNILDTQRVKIPFGIAQIGKAFRNEITPGNFIFRQREFEQMEMEYFVKPGDDEKVHAEWVQKRFDWYVSALGLKPENLRIRHHEKSELAHYAKACCDIEYKFPFGWSEIEGIANRQAHDLTQHQKYSGVDLGYLDEVTKEKYIPYVIEPSCGVERLMFAVICDAYLEIEGGRTTTTESTKEMEVVLKFSKTMAPVKVAVFPLLKNKPDLVAKAREISRALKSQFMCVYDEAGSIGRRYRRQDEIGTCFCVTVDFDSLEKDDVTVRDRDTMKQERIKISDLKNYFGGQLKT
jgi:glycyl-tRNA synthetase